MTPHTLAEILFPADRIRERIGELLASLSQDLPVRDPVVIGILRGSFIFLADLVRGMHHVGLRPRVDFITASSYGRGTESSGRVTWKGLPGSLDVRGTSVLLVDDILDTGRTLHTISRNLRDQAGEVRTCVLLDKPSRRQVPFRADYVGFEVPDAFVVGYGLDYDGLYRELPYIARIAFPDAGRTIPPGPAPR